MAENYKPTAKNVEMIVPPHVFALPGEDGFENDRAGEVYVGRRTGSVWHSGKWRSGEVEKWYVKHKQ